MSDFMTGMVRQTIVANGIGINVWTGGEGPPLLLLHGYPQTAQMWRKITPKLLSSFSLVCPDLRGYGHSDKPRSGYDKRTMAKDVSDLMLSLGHQKFDVVGHDRGGRVAHRLALDYSAIVERLVVLDIVPTHTVFRDAGSQLAATYWHWFFFQTADLPEIMIANNPEAFLRTILRSWGSRADFIDEDVFQEYLRAFKLPGTIRATLEDYRAAASVDLRHDEEDLNTKLRCPVLAVWGARNKTMALFDVVEAWREKANLVEGQGVDCGHFIPEEEPEKLVELVLPFLS